MSLQVWLPLNGDLHNYGLSNCVFTNRNAVVDDNGKIGKCYSFSNKNNSYLSSTLTLSNTGPWSASAWVYPTASSSSEHQYIVGLNSTNSTFLFNLCWYGNKFGIRLGSTTYQSTASYALNIWYHVAFSYNGSQIKLYINGILDKTQAFSSSLNNYTDLYIGKRGGNAGYFSGKLNDIRIYDHALSDKEVKEIAKGLVLHYKLDDSYSEITTNLCNGLKNGGRTTLNNNVITTTGENADTYWYVKTSTPLVSGTTYTLSLECSGLSNSEAFWRFGVGAQNGENCCGNFTIKNGYNTFTFVLPTGLNGVTQFILDDTNRPNWEDVTSFYNVQLEQKDHATGYAGIGGVRNIGYVYDSSGYQNNGIQWSYDGNGSIIQSNDTPKYQLSTYINSDNNTANTASGTRYIYGNCILTSPEQLTVSFWCKPIAGYGGNTGQGQFCLTNIDIGNNAGSDYQAGPMNHRDTGIDLNSADGTVHKRLAITFTANSWHYYTIVYNGRIGTVYTDGIQTATIDMGINTALGTMKGAIIGFSKAGGVWRSNKSYYSDFRIYTTALSNDDILDLYHTPFSIDNKGNSYAREVIEDTELNITKAGQFHGNEMLDDDTFTTASITKTDKQLKVNTLYEY